MIKVCKECGQEFETKYVRQVYCKREHFRPCPVCGKLVLVTALADPPRCCSTECARESAKQTNILKYGSPDGGNTAEAREKRKQTNLAKYGCVDAGNRPEAKEKRKQTNLARYGVEFISQSAEIRDKVKATMQERYNVVSPMQSKVLRDKAVATCLARYGVENPMQSKEIQAKVKATNIERYGVEWNIRAESVRAKAEATMMQRYGTLYPTQLQAIQEKTKQTTFNRYGVSHYTQSDTFKAAHKAALIAKYGVDNIRKIPGVEDKIQNTNMARYGLPYAFMSDEAHEKSRESMIRNMKSHISSFNKSFGDMLSSEQIMFEYEFYLGGKFYDIILPDQKILIEINPTYTHSTEPSFYYPDGHSDKYYHRDKTKLAEDNGYRCIHVFDWDDISSIVRLVSPKHRIYAKSFSVCEVSQEQATEFLSINHIQGSVSGQVVCIGLVNPEDELCAVMTFGAPRYTQKYQFELLRLAFRYDLQIVGGASKMFKYFCKTYAPDSVISYCNRAKFTGHVYSAIGMKLLRRNEPSKLWSKYNKVITDNLLRQRGYDQLFNTDYGKGTSNEKLMRDNGWRSVYDCGQDVYVYLKPEDLR